MAMFSVRHYMKWRQESFQLRSRRFSHSASTLHAINLQNLIGKDSVVSEDLDQYTMDWTQHYHGGGLVCFPSSSRDVSKVFEYCHLNNIAMVPQGGNTGLVRPDLLLSDLIKNRLVVELESIKSSLFLQGD
jgi:hypothetical protein